ncbi:MAG: hypothetical protein AUH26_00190 [Candidatus Rokubacteria bacterium 13_1_40CM_69_96]|nr:MAG: hypothetical protein AUH26_00190 [Candidatus Rokubacteria bacterium 13_1_40CM_69_96]
MTRVSHTMVVRPRWSGVEVARTVPSLAPAKKLVFDSSVVVPAPGGRLRNVAVLGDHAIGRRVDEAHTEQLGETPRMMRGQSGGVDRHDALLSTRGRPQTAEYARYSICVAIFWRASTPQNRSTR